MPIDRSCSCCCSHINSHNQVRGHRTGSSHSGAEEYPRENTHNPRWYTHISQLTQSMPPPETHKSGIGSESTICQVHAGAYVSLLTPAETNYSDCHPRKTTTYISHVVYITTHTHDRRKSIGESKQRKEKIKEREEKRRKRNKTTKARKEKKRQEKQEKTRQEEEARQVKNERKRRKKKKKKKNVILADPRNYIGV